MNSFLVKNTISDFVQNIASDIFYEMSRNSVWLQDNRKNGNTIRVHFKEQGSCIVLCVHTEKSFLNLVDPNQI